MHGSWAGVSLQPESKHFWMPLDRKCLMRNSVFYAGGPVLIPGVRNGICPQSHLCYIIESLAHTASMVIKGNSTNAGINVNADYWKGSRLVVSKLQNQSTGVSIEDNLAKFYQRRNTFVLTQNSAKLWFQNKIHSNNVVSNILQEIMHRCLQQISYKYHTISSESISTPNIWVQTFIKPYVISWGTFSQYMFLPSSHKYRNAHNASCIIWISRWCKKHVWTYMKICKYIIFIQRLSVRIGL